MKIRIVVADDHAIIREGLRIMLGNQPDMEVVGTAANGREAIRLADQYEPDVAVMDISMPELNGIEAIQQMLPRHPHLQVVVLSIHETKPYIYRALKAGAMGYLIKETAGLEVVEAVRAVHRGERYLSQRIADLLTEASFQKSESSMEVSPLEALSPREREILQLVAEGKTSQEIAERLSISPKTVDTYRSRLMHKIGVEDMVGLVKFAIQHGVISLE
ncbi:MAG TPA: response regulator transcription factor [Anaerolineales bacterium]|nr:response regulator transcription factor [Anaerolineales bacterium]